jgi:predicted ATPase/DNA-binding SARP family transcriptional activator
VLLVLDNCEHLVDAVAALAETLLRGCPRLAVLATSREALGVASETAWLVPPLGSGEAVQLFAERARASLPAFALSDANLGAVREICRRLDGIPLAIELAAARVRVLPPERIAERLDHAFRLLTSGSRTALPRHRTLRGTMDWSHALLTDRERTLLRRLAVFAGSFALEAAEAVCADAAGALRAEDVLDGVAGLVDKSLVALDTGVESARYRLLETVRQYADERLREAGEAEALRAAHARHFVAFAEAAEPHLFAGAGEAAWIARVEAESGNLRAAAAWAEEDASRDGLLLRLCAAVNWFWFATGQFAEGRQRLSRALARTQNGSPDDDAADPLVRGRALVALGYLATWQGDHPAVRPAAEAGVALLRGRADAATLAEALVGLAAAHVLEGDGVAAGRAADEALEAARAVPPHALHSLVLYWHGWAARLRGDGALARASLEEAVANGRRVGHRPAIAHPLAMLGRLALAEAGLDRARLDEARARFAESLKIHAETEDAWGTAIALEGLAAVAVARGTPRRAATLMAASDSLRTRIASALTPAERDEHARLVDGVRVALGADFARLWAEGRARALPETIRLALDDAPDDTSDEPPNDPVGAPVAAAGLRVLALGPLAAYRGDEPIDPAAWGSARTRELLVFLLVHPEGVTKEQVGLALWPEASAAQLRNSFHVTLHRLRRALGERGAEWVALTNDRYRLDPAAVRGFDVAEFERDVAAARGALRRGDDGAADAMERALARYRGDFLDGEPAGDWHLAHRARLQRLHLDALVALGDRLAEDEAPERAAEAYRRALARDGLHEEAVRSLMRCHARAGDRAEALRVHDRFATRLRDELGAEPSRETTGLARRIRG